MLELASEIGFEATTIEEVTERAGVGREEFDQLFDSKEECAIAVFDQFMAGFVVEVRAAYERQAEWPDSLRAAAYAVADWMQAHPREARFGAVEMLWIGGVAQAKREASFQMFVELIDGGRELAPDPASVPAYAAEGVIGSMAKMITDRLQDSAVDPHEFVPDLMYLAVLSYLGEEAAKQELTLPRPEAP
jgi:AcrR family transcriptional regulator